MQLMHRPFRKINGVLLTHIHYDHVAGIDDLRGFCKFGDIDIYANQQTVDALRVTMPYCFTPKLYPGVPLLNLHAISPAQKGRIGDIAWEAVEVMHDWLPIMAYRFGTFAYVTDMKTISDENRERLRGVKTLVVNALRFEREHHSHMLVGDAVAFARSIGAERTFLTHLTHEIGFHDEANSRLPEDVRFAYDGLTIEV
jgi:phosphoribosyl 1,2-cyclic phosphate phosphodiesterase